MLVLGRKKGETLLIGDSIEITVVEVQGDNVKLSIQAPREVSIFRKEVFEEIKSENLKAAENVHSLEALEKLKNFQINDKD